MTESKGASGSNPIKSALPSSWKAVLNPSTQANECIELTGKDVGPPVVQPISTWPTGARLESIAQQIYRHTLALPKQLVIGAVKSPKNLYSGTQNIGKAMSYLTKSCIRNHRNPDGKEGELYFISLAIVTAGLYMWTFITFNLWSSLVPNAVLADLMAIYTAYIERKHSSSTPRLAALSMHFVFKLAKYTTDVISAVDSHLFAYFDIAYICIAMEATEAVTFDYEGATHPETHNLKQKTAVERCKNAELTMLQHFRDGWCSWVKKCRAQHTKQETIDTQAMYILKLTFLFGQIRFAMRLVTALVVYTEAAPQLSKKAAGKLPMRSTDSIISSVSIWQAQSGNNSIPAMPEHINLAVLHYMEFLFGHVEFLNERLDKAKAEKQHFITTLGLCDFSEPAVAAINSAQCCIDGILRLTKGPEGSRLPPDDLINIVNDRHLGVTTDFVLRQCSHYKKLVPLQKQTSIYESAETLSPARAYRHGLPDPTTLFGSDKKDQ